MTGLLSRKLRTRSCVPQDCSSWQSRRHCSSWQSRRRGFPIDRLDHEADSAVRPRIYLTRTRMRIAGTACSASPIFPACCICLRAIPTSSQRPPWQCPLGFQRKVIALCGHYADCAHSLARRARAVCIATAPSRIMAPIGMAASSGRTSATHTTRLPPISRAYTCTAPL